MAYGSFTPYFVVSDSPDLSSNKLPNPAAETFTVARRRFERSIDVPAYSDPGPNTHVPIYLSGWEYVDAARVQVRNTGTVLVYVIFVPVGKAGTTNFYLPNQANTIVVPGGTTADIMARIGDSTGTLVTGLNNGFASYDGQFAIQAESGPTADGTTIELTILEDTTVNVDVL